MGNQWKLGRSFADGEMDRMLSRACKVGEYRWCEAHVQKQIYSNALIHFFEPESKRDCLVPGIYPYLEDNKLKLACVKPSDKERIVNNLKDVNCLINGKPVRLIEFQKESQKVMEVIIPVSQNWSQEYLVKDDLVILEFSFEKLVLKKDFKELTDLFDQDVDFNKKIGRELLEFNGNVSVMPFCHFTDFSQDISFRDPFCDENN